MIPSCLKLESRQIAALKKWRDSFPRQTIEEMEENYGGMTITCDTWFELRSTGLGDDIIAHCGDRKINIGIDDNNELACDYPPDKDYYNDPNYKFS